MAAHAHHPSTWETEAGGGSGSPPLVSQGLQSSLCSIGTLKSQPLTHSSCWSHMNTFYMWKVSQESWGGHGRRVRHFLLVWEGSERGQASLRIVFLRLVTGGGKGGVGDTAQLGRAMAEGTQGSAHDGMGCSQDGNAVEGLGLRAGLSWRVDLWALAFIHLWLRLVA